MKSVKVGDNLVSAALGACMLLLLSTGAVEAEEDVSYYTQAKLRADDGAPGDILGSSVAISGDIAVIGAFGDDDLGSGAGSAYVFERHPVDPALWIQTAKLYADDGAAGDVFGVRVAISGHTAVFGASEDDDLGSRAGSAYVFERHPVDPALWTQTAKLTADDGEADDRFGISVSISADTAIIGADDLSGPGSAYVFERDPLDPTRWTQSAKLIGDDGGRGGDFGWSVAISGDTAVVGDFDTGAAFIFERDPIDPAVWNRTAKLAADDGGGFFGYSVAISGDTALIGSTGADAAYVFQRDAVDPTLWSQTAKLSGAAGTGQSVAVSDDAAVIGAYLDQSSGSAYVFERDPLDSAVWNQTARLTAPGGAPLDFFGYSVGISGRTAVIGAHRDDDLGEDSGSAYLFRRILIDPALAVSGACPGELIFDGSGLTPLGPVEMWGGLTEGSFTIPDGPCAGHELGIADARRLLGPGRADEDGGGSAVRTLPDGRCDARLQLLDLTSCAMTGVVPLP